MSSTSRAWVAAASVGTVEALKDQGFCRWNYANAMRHLQQHAKTNLRSYTQSKKLSNADAFSFSSTAERQLGDDELKQSEESLRKVMYLSCWGPY